MFSQLLLVLFCYRLSGVLVVAMDCRCYCSSVLVDPVAVLLFVAYLALKDSDLLLFSCQKFLSGLLLLLFQYRIHHLTGLFIFEHRHPSLRELH